MKIKVNKLIIFLVLLSIIGTIFIFDRLPEKVPGHFNFSGEVDRYDNKTSLFFTAISPLALYLLMIFLPKIDPRRKSYLKHQKAYGIIQMAIVIFLILIHWLVILISLGYSINIGILLRVGVGFLFLILGNYMSQIRQNYFLGIKTPWTLASERVWRKTHRVGGISFVISGLLLILTSFTKGTIAVVAFILSFLIVTVIPYGYSYMEYKKEDNDFNKSN